MFALWRAMWNLDTDEIRRLNVLMNGPRVIWGRMPSLTLSLFILFTDRVETYGKESTPIPGAISWIADKLVNRTFSMFRYSDTGFGTCLKKSLKRQNLGLWDKIGTFLGPIGDF